jgi:hypothetical protein
MTIFNGDGPVGASRSTFAAAFTERLVKAYFRSGGDVFRVAAPPAGKPAAFEEHQGSYAGPVVNRIALDIGYQRFFHRLVHISENSAKPGLDRGRYQPLCC